MAKLTPNTTYTTPNGILVKEHIIPDGYRWKNATAAKAAGFNVGDLYKKNKKLSGGTGKVKWITIHNTPDLQNVHDDGEQYTRATYPNEAMGSSRVHFYVDDTCAWQNLKAGTGMSPNDPKGSAEVGWHAADGSTSTGGNMTSLAIEIIMNDSTSGHDARAYDNGAKLAAWLLWKNGLPISKLVTHSYWNAKKAGKTSSDIDQQCVTYVSGAHWCPLYIFDSKNEAGAKKNWKAFKAVVNGYLEELKNPAPETAPEDDLPTPFVDVPAGKYYATPVKWGYENGITSGTDKTHFSPDRPITRGEVMTMLYRHDQLLNKK